MEAIRSYKEIIESIENVKKLNAKFVTNFFLNENKITQWIENEVLFSIVKNNSVFIIRKHIEFYYLYYFSTDLSELFVELEDLKIPQNSDYVIDIVGKADDLHPILFGFQSQGYFHHETLKRMISMQKKLIEKSELPSEVSFATLADAHIVFDFLLQRLDKYSEQIPSIMELQIAIHNNNLLVAKINDEIAGLLYFEKIGLTSHLKEWLVNEKYQGRKIGSGLIKTYFSLCENCNRFILWVKENNDSAIKKYEHYGYKMESLQDIIMVKHN